MTDMLPNPRKGEAIIVIDGEEHMIKFTFSTLVKLQKSTGKNVNDLFVEMGKGDLDLITQVIYAGICKAGKWPDSYGPHVPTKEQLMDRMTAVDIEDYLIALATALKGAEFAEGMGKKLKEARAEIFAD